MNLDYVHTLRDMVSQQAVDMKWRRVPHFQIPYVEYNVPTGEDAEKVLADMQRRLVMNPNAKARLVMRGAQQVRVRVEYWT